MTYHHTPHLLNLNYTIPQYIIQVYFYNIQNNSTIFKTIETTDDNGLTNTKIVTALKARKIAQDELDTYLIKQQNTLKDDTKALKNLEKAIKTNVPYKEAYAQTMTKASVAAKEHAIQTKGAAGATEIFVAKQKAAQAKLNTTTATTKAASIAMKTLSAIGSMAVFTLITKGIELAVTAINNYIHRLKNANEALEESKSEYSSVTSELTSLQDELTTTSERIDELNSKESLSLVEDEELEKLKESTKELEYQIALKKEEQRIAAEETLSDAKDVYNTTVTSDYDKRDTHGNSVGNQVTVTEELENSIEEYKKQEQSLEAARERFFELDEKKQTEGLSQGQLVSSNHGHSTAIVGNEEQEYEDLKNEITEIEAAMTSASNRAYEMSTYIENVRASLQTIQNNGGMMSSDDLNILAESTAYMDKYQDFYNYQQGILENFDKMDVSEQRNALVDKLKKSGLTESAAQEIIDNTDNADLEIIAKIRFHKNETKESVEGAIEKAQKIASEAKEEGISGTTAILPKQNPYRMA